MRAFLFNRRHTEVYELVDQVFLFMECREDEVSDFSHMFGGGGEREGEVPPGCKKPVHLFFDLDLRDPRVGVTFPDPYARYLPLYYPLGNVGGPFKYRVADPDTVVMYSQPYPPKWRAHAMKNYPPPFEPAQLELVPRGYDPKDVNDVFFCGGVLGIAGLTARQKAKLKKDFLKFYRDEIGVDLIAEDYDGDAGVTMDEIAAGYTPYTQGTPEHPCPNPDCENRATPLPVLVVLDPDKDDPFYARIAGGDSGQLVWQVCERCGGVVVTNPAT